MSELPTGIVTFFLTDVEGSTRLWVAHPDAMPQAVARHDELVSHYVRQHQGLLLKSRGEGDSHFAVFSRTTDALQAALDLQLALREKVWSAPVPLRVRVALHVGEAELRDGDYYGLSVIRCSRLRGVAHGGQVLLSHTAAELVQDALPKASRLKSLGSHRLRDLSRAEPVFQLLHPDLPASFPPLHSLSELPNNLPLSSTSFVGRKRQINEVKRLLSTSRLVTLTGSGGTGKTRLLLQVGTELLEEPPDGIWLVELAPVAGVDLVPHAVASVLAIREEPGRPLLQTLAEALEGRRLLILLDNCEHLLQGCATLVDALLRNCPGVRILASSREAMYVPGESVYRVPSLAVPDPDQLFSSVEELAAYEAVQLFCDRMRNAVPSFALTSENASSVAQLCWRLDGIPLAIELAAARARTLPVSQILARLDGVFRLLTGGGRTAPPRHQTLQALVDWSHDLLSDAERTLFRRLSVFRGGWQLEAAEAVCPDELPGGRGEIGRLSDTDVLDLLSSLVDKSLVLYEERQGSARYRLLETLRQFSRDRLADSGESSRLQYRHLEYYTAHAESLAGFWTESGVGDQMEADLDNLRAALDCAASSSGNIEMGLRLSIALHQFWILRNLHQEGAQWFRQLIDAHGEITPLLRCRALVALGHLLTTSGRMAEAPNTVEEGARLARTLQDPGLLAQSLQLLGRVARDQRDFPRALALFQESRAAYQEASDENNAAWISGEMGLAAEMQGDLTAACHLHEEHLRIAQRTGHRLGEGWALQALGQLHLKQQNYPSARLLLEESLVIKRETGDRFGVLMVLDILMWRAWAEQDLEQYRALFVERLPLEPGSSQRARTMAHMAEFEGEAGHPERAQAVLEEAYLLPHLTPDDRARLLNGLGREELRRGEYSAARHHYEEVLALLSPARESYRLGWAHLFIGHTAWLQCDDTAARHHMCEALKSFQVVNDSPGILSTLESLAGDAHSCGQPARAARLLAAACTLHQQMAVGTPVRWRHPQYRILEALRGLPEACCAAWEAGQAMSLDDATVFALEMEEKKVVS